LLIVIALQAPGFVQQLICRKEGGVHMWETQKDAEAFYTGPWRDGIRARYGNDPKIQYFETVALTDKASGKAGGFKAYPVRSTQCEGGPRSIRKSADRGLSS
jgi:hypothetical protein